MSTEENKALVRRYIEEVGNGHNLAVIDELFAADYVGHGWRGADTVGPERMKQFVVSALTSFPDWQFTIEDLIAEGDRVVARLTGQATHQGELWGIPPTGTRVTVTETHIYRIAGGKIVERWDEVDRLGLMQQLGAVPAPEEPAVGDDQGDPA